MDNPPPHPSLSASPPTEINLLTLNCWAIRHISTLREPRIAHIARLLAATASAFPSPSSFSSSSLKRPDIVCLQELFTQQDYNIIRHETRQILPYGKFFHAGPFGAGLVILSRWPIRDASTHPYPLNGRPTAFWRGDWYVGKGIARATVQFGPDPVRHVIDVFNTHTHSPYEKGPDVDDNAYLCHRISQAWELAKLVRLSSSSSAAQHGSGGHLVAALGDFNVHPGSLPHRLITSLSPLRDVWHILHPDSSLGPAHHPAEKARRRPCPSAECNLTENGATSNNVLNTWRWDKDQLKKLKAGSPCDINPDTPDPHGQRLDYIFVSAGSDPASSPSWVVKSAAVTLTERHPELGVSLSDHFAVQATITLHTPSSASASAPSSSSSHPPTSSIDSPRPETFLAPPDTPTSKAPSTLAPAHGGFDAQLHSYHGHGDTLPLSVYDDILSLIHRYTLREQKQRYWRGIHFHASLVVWVACLVGIWFTPHKYPAFLLMLFGSLNLVAGTIDGLLALLFFNSELRALKEFEWEIRNAKSAASGELVVSSEDSHDAKL
jgi:sphingomyelin phosphodiesterase 2